MGTWRFHSPQAWDEIPTPPCNCCVALSKLAKFLRLKDPSAKGVIEEYLLKRVLS